MKKVLGCLLLGIAALAMPVALFSATGCGSDVGKSEQIEGVEEKHGEGHGEEFKQVSEGDEKPPEEM